MVNDTKVAISGALTSFLLNMITENKGEFIVALLGNSRIHYSDTTRDQDQPSSIETCINTEVTIKDAANCTIADIIEFESEALKVDVLKGITQAYKGELEFLGLLRCRKSCSPDNDLSYIDRVLLKALFNYSCLLQSPHLYIQTSDQITKIHSIKYILNCHVASHGVNTNDHTYDQWFSHISKTHIKIQNLGSEIKVEYCGAGGSRSFSDLTTRVNFNISSSESTIKKFTLLEELFKVEVRKYSSKIEKLNIHLLKLQIEVEKLMASYYKKVGNLDEYKKVTSIQGNLLDALKYVNRNDKVSTSPQVTLEEKLQSTNLESSEDEDAFISC